MTSNYRKLPRALTITGWRGEVLYYAIVLSLTVSVFRGILNGKRPMAMLFASTHHLELVIFNPTMQSCFSLVFLQGERLFITDPKALSYIYQSGYNFIKSPSRSALSRITLGPGLLNVEGKAKR